MPHHNFDESLLNAIAPWKICAALEAFFAEGGTCSLSDVTNWAGITFTCARKAHGDPPDSAQIGHMLGWAYAAIMIRESLASTSEDSWGTIKGAMWVRADLIIRFGHYPKDYLLDSETVVRWSLATTEVQILLKLENVPAYRSLSPEVREIEQILLALVNGGRLQEQGDVARVLGLVRQSRQNTAG